MPRSRFRSQPTLQRTRTGPPPWLAALGLVAAVSLGSAIALRLPLGADSAAPTPASVPVLAPPPLIEAPVLQVASAAGLPSAPAAASPVPVEPQGPVQEPRPLSRREAMKAAETTTVQAERAEDLLKAQASWDEQLREYDRARQADQMQQRAEGYAWAERSAVRAHGDCQAMGQRTAAFMAGCFEYLRIAEEADPPRRADRS